MTITVNGAPKDVAQGTTVRALIEQLGLGTQACAAELNKNVVPRKRHETTTLSDGDKVELVTLVGGG